MPITVRRVRANGSLDPRFPHMLAPSPYSILLHNNNIIIVILQKSPGPKWLGRYRESILMLYPRQQLN